MVWGEARQDTVTGFASDLGRWARAALDFPELAAVVFQFLTTPAAKALRAEGLSWAASIEIEEHLWSEPLRKRLVWYLDTVWEENREDLDSRRLGQFTRILNGLCEHSERGALLLRQQVEL